MHCRAKVQDARNQLWQVMPVFKDLEELKQWLEDCYAIGVLTARRIALWSETAHRELLGSVADAWEAEKPVLMVDLPLLTGLLNTS